MTFQPVTIRPGINLEFTLSANEGGWSDSGNLRFRFGMAEKIGGWQRMSSTALVGVCRGMHVWSDLAGNPYLGLGTDQRLEVFNGGLIEDITPLRQTDNVIVPDFSTTMGDSTVTVGDTGSNTSAGDWVRVVAAISVGGIILQGLYQIVTAIDGDTYTIDAGTPATSTVVSGGAATVFNTTLGSPNVTATLNDSNLAAGGTFTVHVATTVGGITLDGLLSVSAPVTANTFTLAPGTVATSTVAGAENTGAARLEYLISNGFADATASGGYGAGDYGGGDYGGDNGAVILPLRQWFLDNFGEDLIGNYTNGPAYYWVPPDDIPAVLVPNGPTAMTASFVAMPEEIFVALGAETVGIRDPNLVRWSDAGDFSVWTATATNQAGSFRIPTGSRIVGGIQAPQQGLIWTDVDVWAMQYVQPPFIFGFTKIGAECGLISGRAVGVIGDRVVWMSQRNFYIIDGQGVRVLPCTVWDFVFKNLNLIQADKCFCAVNSLFNEVEFFFPSASGNGEIDSSAKYNVVENSWDVRTLVRTAWVDVSALGPPIGVDANRLLQQHDVAGVYDDDGNAMTSFAESGYFSIGEGTYQLFLERIIPDFVWSATPSIAPVAGSMLTLTVKVTDYPAPENPIYTFGPFTITPATRYVIIRARSRYASIRIEANGVGTFFRQGKLLHNAQQSGRRP